MPMTDEMPAATALEAISGRLRALDPRLSLLAAALANLAAEARAVVVSHMIAGQQELVLHRAAGGRIH